MKNVTSESCQGLDLLRKPFPEHQISLLPMPTKKDNPKGKCSVCNGFHGLPAVHLKYVGHAALTDRLLEADPKWYWEPLAYHEGLPAFDKTGGLWIKLTVCGVTRLGYGHAEISSFKEIGAREKEVIGDALRNAAMRFGAALELWHKGDLHLDEEPEENKDPATAYFDSIPPESNLNEEIPSFDELPKVPVKSKIAEVQKQLKNIGSFVITVGSWKNKTLDEVVEEHGLGELRSRFNFWNKNDGKPKGQIMRELIDAVGIYLDANGGR